jgi:hypothetical protein
LASLIDKREDLQAGSRADETVGKDGGYIAAPAHDVPGDVPVENMVAMIDELQKSGADELQGCRGEDNCLYEIGKALNVKRIVGIQVNGKAKNYRVVLKSFDLEKGIYPPEFLAFIKTS